MALSHKISPTDPDFERTAHADMIKSAQSAVSDYMADPKFANNVSKDAEEKRVNSSKPTEVFCKRLTGRRACGIPAV